MTSQPYEAELNKSFEITIRSRLGEGCEGPQEIGILNRIVSVNAKCLTYEAYPRHGDLLSSPLGFTAESSAATPGVKPVDQDANATKSDEPETPSLLDYSDPDKVISAILMGKYDSESGSAECGVVNACCSTSRSPIVSSEAERSSDAKPEGDRDACCSLSLSLSITKCQVRRQLFTYCATFSK